MPRKDDRLMPIQDSTANGATIRCRAVDAVAALQRASVERGLDTLADEDIAAEIATVRTERSR